MPKGNGSVKTLRQAKEVFHGYPLYITKAFVIKAIILHRFMIIQLEHSCLEVLLGIGNPIWPFTIQLHVL
jgi:hypothetical protein